MVPPSTGAADRSAMTGSTDGSRPTVCGSSSGRSSTPKPGGLDPQTHSVILGGWCVPHATSQLHRVARPRFRPAPPRPGEPGLVSDPYPPDPDPISTVAAPPRIVGRMERPSREPELSTDGNPPRRQSDPLLVAIGAFRDFVRVTIKGATCRGTLAMGFVVVARMAKTGDPIADVALVLFALYLGAILGRPLDRWLSKRGPSRRAAHERATDAGALIAAATPGNDPIDQNPGAEPAPKARGARRGSRSAGQRGHP